MNCANLGFSMVQLFVAGQPLWSASNTFVKLSILHLYSTIFTNNKSFKICVYTLISLCIGYAISDWLKLFLICRPFEYSWNKSIEGECADALQGWLVTGIMNLLLDVGIVVLPLPLLWRLHLSISKRIGLTLMFTIGAGFVTPNFRCKFTYA